MGVPCVPTAVPHGGPVCISAAERVTSLGKDWHRPCLKCEKCGKTLTSGGHAEVSGASGAAGVWRLAGTDSNGPFLCSTKASPIATTPATPPCLGPKVCSPARPSPGRATWLPKARPSLPRPNPAPQGSTQPPPTANPAPNSLTQPPMPNPALQPLTCPLLSLQALGGVELRVTLSSKSRYAPIPHPSQVAFRMGPQS